MTRPIFYPSNDSYTLSYQGEPQAGVPVQLFTRQVGGVQVTDLVYVGYDGALGAAVPSGVLISDSFGLLPAFAGPDGGALTLWGNHGPQGERIALSSEPVAGVGGGGSVFSVVGQTGTVTGSQILADGSVSAALSEKAPLASPTFTGTPTVPTATAGTSTTQAASTAFVATAVSTGGAVSSVVGQTGPVTGAQIVADAAVAAALTAKAPLASPTFTGTPTAPTPTAGDNDTSIATTAFVAAAVATGGAVASVVGQTGVVTGTQLLADSAVSAALAAKAPLASPALTGAPTVPTASPGTATTQAASTAFTAAAVAVETTRATTAEGLAAQKTANLSDLTSPATARTNLNLGAAATLSTAQIAADVALTSAFGPGSDLWLKTQAAAFSFAFATITTTDLTTGLPTAGTLLWPDGTGGAFTGTVTSTGYSGYAATWTGSTTRTTTASGITYDSNGNQLGPTSLVVS